MKVEESLANFLLVFCKLISFTDQAFFDEAILTPTLSGITPAHQLVINSSRKQFGLSFGNALRVSNVPSSYSPRLLLKLFKSRYPSAYRAFIPLPKAKWKLKNVRDKLRGKE